MRRGGSRRRRLLVLFNRAADPCPRGLHSPRPPSESKSGLMRSTLGRRAMDYHVAEARYMLDLRPAPRCWIALPLPRGRPRPPRGPPRAAALAPQQFAGEAIRLGPTTSPCVEASLGLPAVSAGSPRCPATSFQFEGAAARLGRGRRWATELAAARLLRTPFGLARTARDHARLRPSRLSHLLTDSRL